MARTAVPVQTQPGRAGAAGAAPVALNALDGHILAGGVTNFYFEVVNTDGANPVTVTAVRAACPTCGATVDLAGKGAVTVNAGATGFLGPLPANLYGQGTDHTDVYLDVTGTGTGTIKAYKA